MTHTDPSADAFMRRILSNPADAVPRLVFADWLEESGTSSNLAWARYLRLADELANAPPDDARRPKMASEVAKVGSLIQARLRCRAEVFVAYPEAMLQLLPARCLFVNLNSVTVPQEVVDFVPESYAFERQALPLAVVGRTLFVATPSPTRVTCQALEFALTLRVRPLVVPSDQLELALGRHYPPLFVSYGLPPVGNPDLRLVNLLVREAIQSRAIVLELEPTADHVRVWNHLPTGRVERTALPAARMGPVVDGFRLVADIVGGDGPRVGEFRHTVHGNRYQMQVRLTPTEFGPHVLVTILPPDPKALAALNPAA